MVDTIFEILYVIGCVAVFYLIIFYFSNWKQKKREALWKKNDEESQRHIEGLKVSKSDEISEQIISILDEYIKPAVSSDGGNIVFDSYDPKEKVVKVILQGACSGCPSSTITLKNGIENILKEMLSTKVDKVEAING